MGSHRYRNRYWLPDTATEAGIDTATVVESGEPLRHECTAMKIAIVRVMMDGRQTLLSVVDNRKSAMDAVDAIMGEAETMALTGGHTVDRSVVLYFDNGNIYVRGRYLNDAETEKGKSLLPVDFYMTGKERANYLLYFNGKVYQLIAMMGDAYSVKFIFMDYKKALTAWITAVDGHADVQFSGKLKPLRTGYGVLAKVIPAEKKGGLVSVGYDKMIVPITMLGGKMVETNNPITPTYPRLIDAVAYWQNN